MEATQTNYKSLIISIIKTTGALLAPVVLMVMPIDFFDTGQSICLSKVFFDMECYACGMTRAGMHLLHFDFKGAYDFNPLIYLVVPIAAFGIFMDLRTDFKRVVNYIKSKKADSAS
jgi:hypothetical protein